MRFKLLKNKKESQKQQEKSLGRSMVEMLGVLAIIGVLSIGGISGYTIAMRRFRANEIVNLVNKYALTVYTNCQNAMMNDSENYYINNQGVWVCPPSLDFPESGLGPLPSEVVEFDLDRYFVVDIFTKSENGKTNDYVAMSFAVKTKDLCDSVVQIVGLGSWGDDTKLGEACNESSRGRVDITFIMD